MSAFPLLVVCTIHIQPYTLPEAIGHAWIIALRITHDNTISENDDAILTLLFAFATLTVHIEKITNCTGKIIIMQSCRRPWTACRFPSMLLVCSVDDDAKLTLSLW